MTDPSFAERYGPWVLVAGASDGVGAAFARAVAERECNVVLLARRQAVLDEVAAGIRADTGVDARAVSVDLAAPSAMTKVREATDGLEVGMLMYNAGADARYEPFLDSPVEDAVAMVHRNCVVPVEMAHHFGRPMVARGGGGIILVSSGAGMVGAPNMVAYGASKAFDIVMGEALWGELEGAGVDVLSLVLGATDTPAFRQLLVKRGSLPHEDAPIPFDVSTTDEVVTEALEHLGHGPTWFVGESTRNGIPMLMAMPRNEAVLVMRQAAAAMDAP